MKPYKWGDRIKSNGKMFTIYDVCNPCRRVYAKDEDGINHLFRYKDGRLKLETIQNEPEEDKAVRELIYEALK